MASVCSEIFSNWSARRWCRRCCNQSVRSMSANHFSEKVWISRRKTVTTAVVAAASSLDHSPAIRMQPFNPIRTKHPFPIKIIISYFYTEIVFDVDYYLLAFRRLTSNRSSPLKYTECTRRKWYRMIVHILSALVTDRRGQFRYFASKQKVQNSFGWDNMKRHRCRRRKQ